MDDARGIDFPDFLGHFLVVSSERGLVAQGPAEDAGVIFERLHHPGAAFHNRLFPFGKVGGILLAVSESVCFVIGFRKDVETVFIADGVETRIVGVV